MNPILQKAELLYEQKRWEDSLRACQEYLTSDPEDASTLCLAARCCLNLELFGFASEFADKAVEAAPDSAYAYYIRGYVNYARNLDEEAHQSVDVALELDPTNPEYHILKARLYLNRSEWLRAHDTMESVLFLNPNYGPALLVKARALTRLRHYDEAKEVLLGLLERDPEELSAHIELGNLYLFLSEWKVALTSFEDALAIDPESIEARNGLMEALRAHYPLYGLVLRYSLWLNHHSKEYQQMIQFSLPLAARMLDMIRREFPVTAWLIGLVLLVWRIFFYLTWTIRAGTTLLLRLNKYGRRLVDGEEILESNLVGGCWLLALGMWLYHVFVDPFTMVCRIGMPVFLSLPLVVGGAFSIETKAWPRYAAHAILGVEAVAAVVGMVLLAIGHAYAFTLLGFYVKSLPIAILLLSILGGIEPARE